LNGISRIIEFHQTTPKRMKNVVQLLSDEGAKNANWTQTAHCKSHRKPEASGD
jgi:hypothetical protein